MSRSRPRLVAPCELFASMANQFAVRRSAKREGDQPRTATAASSPGSKRTHSWCQNSSELRFDPCVLRIQLEHEYVWVDGGCAREAVLPDPNTAVTHQVVWLVC